MAYENIVVETRDRVGLITLNRPKAHNAFNAQVTERFSEEVAVLLAADGARAVLPEAAGQRSPAAPDTHCVKHAAELTQEDNR